MNGPRNWIFLWGRSGRNGGDLTPYQPRESELEVPCAWYQIKRLVRSRRWIQMQHSGDGQVLEGCRFVRISEATATISGDQIWDSKSEGVWLPSCIPVVTSGMVFSCNLKRNLIKILRHTLLASPGPPLLPRNFSFSLETHGFVSKIFVNAVSCH